jgi:alpha-glucosidase
LHWRREQAPLISGDIRFIDGPKGLVTFLRTQGEDTIVCAFNLSRQPISWTPPKGALPLENSGFKAAQTADGWTIPPVGALFLGILADA